jgi:hypothetical protein
VDGEGWWEGSGGRGRKEENYSIPALGFSHFKPCLDVIQNELTEAAYPQYHRLVQLALTLPVGAPSVERSFFAMRRIRNWMRLTTGQERFSSLALLHIESDLTAALDPEQLVQMNACCVFSVVID